MQAGVRGALGQGAQQPGGRNNTQACGAAAVLMYVRNKTSETRHDQVFLEEQQHRVCLKNLS